jgi:hypothetical protein
MITLNLIILNSQLLKDCDDRHMIVVVTETFGDITHRVWPKKKNASQSVSLQSSGETGKGKATVVRLSERASPIHGITGPPD